MNCKVKGSRNERRSRSILEAAGYGRTRAAASLGAWDLVGIRAADLVVVQVKTRDWPGSAELEALAAFPCPSVCRRVVHRWRDGHRSPDVRDVR